MTVANAVLCEERSTSREKLGRRSPGVDSRQVYLKLVSGVAEQGDGRTFEGLNDNYFVSAG